MGLFEKWRTAISRAAGRAAWNVSFAERGRDGYVYYRKRLNVIEFYWEFGGGDVVAIVSGDKPDAWRKSHRWAAGRQREILGRVADEVIRQRVPGCGAEIVESEGCIYFRKQSAQ